MVSDMDFKFNNEQILIRRVAREFALSEFTSDLARDMDDKCYFPWELYKKAADLRLLRPSISEEYGGGDYGMLEEVMVHEEFTRVDSTIGQAILSGAFGSKILDLYGSDRQKRTLLNRVLRGDVVTYAAFTEPEHGSDITRLGTKAVKKGDRWIINGRKIFITNAPIAEFGIVLCQTGDMEPSYRYQTMFIIYNDAQGVRVSEMKGKLGQHGSPIGELQFDEVEVSPDDIVGRENRGFYQALHFFSFGRLRAAANAIGMSLGAFDKALEYALSREQFGRKIFDFQAISHKISNMLIKIEAARLLLYRAAWYIDREDVDNRKFSILSSIAKLFASEMASYVADQAIQILGGYGYMKEFDVERIARDVRVIRIYEGTTEILHNIISELLKEGRYRV
jgi:alkylation response protein AidB-like acyl-CoA dehydrogenase